MEKEEEVEIQNLSPPCDPSCAPAAATVVVCDHPPRLLMTLLQVVAVYRLLDHDARVHYPLVVAEVVILLRHSMVAAVAAAAVFVVVVSAPTTSVSEKALLVAVVEAEDSNWLKRPQGNTKREDSPERIVVVSSFLLTRNSDAFLHSKRCHFLQTNSAVEIQVIKKKYVFLSPSVCFFLPLSSTCIDDRGGF